MGEHGHADATEQPSNHFVTDRLVKLLTKLFDQFDQKIEDIRSAKTLSAYDVSLVGIGKDDVNTAVGYLAEIGLTTDAHRLMKQTSDLIHVGMGELLGEAAAQCPPGEREVYSDLFGKLPSPAGDDPLELQIEEDRRIAIFGRIASLRDYLEELLETVTELHHTTVERMIAKPDPPPPDDALPSEFETHLSGNQLKLVKCLWSHKSGANHDQIIAAVWGIKSCKTTANVYTLVNESRLNMPKTGWTITTSHKKYALSK